jgi:hypothetical protein
MPGGSPVRRRSIVTVVAIVALTACDASAGASGARVASVTASPSAAGGTPGPTGPAEITLAVAGDVHFTERTLRLLRDPDTAFGPIATILRRADVAMVNLESAVTTRGTPEPKRFHFRAPPTAYQAVKAAGIDVVSLANNHALDYGRVGLLDTLDAATAAGVGWPTRCRRPGRRACPWSAPAGTSARRTGPGSPRSRG